MGKRDIINIWEKMRTLVFGVKEKKILFWGKLIYFGKMYIKKTEVSS